MAEGNRSEADLLLQYEGQIVPRSFNAGFVALSYVVSLIGALSTLELINRRTSPKGKFNHLLLMGSAVTMGGIAIWCMVSATLQSAPANSNHQIGLTWLDPPALHRQPRHRTGRRCTHAPNRLLLRLHGPLLFHPHSGSGGRLHRSRDPGFRVVVARHERWRPGGDSHLRDALPGECVHLQLQVRVQPRQCRGGRNHRCGGEYCGPVHVFRVPRGVGECVVEETSICDGAGGSGVGNALVCGDGDAL